MAETQSKIDKASVRKTAIRVDPLPVKVVAKSIFPQTGFSGKIEIGLE